MKNRDLDSNFWEKFSKISSNPIRKIFNNGDFQDMQENINHEKNRLGFKDGLPIIPSEDFVRELDTKVSFTDDLEQLKNSLNKNFFSRWINRNQIEQLDSDIRLLEVSIHKDRETLNIIEYSDQIQENMNNQLQQIKEQLSNENLYLSENLTAGFTDSDKHKIMEDKNYSVYEEFDEHATTDDIIKKVKELGLITHIEPADQYDIKQQINQEFTNKGFDYVVKNLREKSGNITLDIYDRNDDVYMVGVLSYDKSSKDWLCEDEPALSITGSNLKSNMPIKLQGDTFTIPKKGSKIQNSQSDTVNKQINQSSKISKEISL